MAVRLSLFYDIINLLIYFLCFVTISTVSCPVTYKDKVMASFNKDAISGTPNLARRVRETKTRGLHYEDTLPRVYGKRAYRRLRENKRNSTSLISCFSRQASAVFGGAGIWERR